MKILKIKWNLEPPYSENFEYLTESFFFYLFEYAVEKCVISFKYILTQ